VSFTSTQETIDRKNKSKEIIEPSSSEYTRIPQVVATVIAEEEDEEDIDGNEALASTPVVAGRNFVIDDDQRLGGSNDAIIKQPIQKRETIPDR
jgi:hypothetical protein